jgi:hypothetical protein
VSDGGLCFEGVPLPRRAFATLRRYSQHHNVKLKVLCHQLVETRALPSQEATDIESADGPPAPDAPMTAALPEPA